MSDNQRLREEIEAASPRCLSRYERSWPRLS